MKAFPLFLLAAFGWCAPRALAADPVWLRASFATPASGAWRTQQPLTVRVEVGLRGDDVPQAGLTLAPGQWVTLTLTDAAGKKLETKWTPSAGQSSTPLQVFPGQRRSFYFALTEAGRHQLAPPPGRYTLRATLRSAVGPGWQGSVEAPPLALTVLDEVLPEVSVSIPAGGEIAPGDPLLVAVTFAATPDFRAGDGFMAPDFSQRSWREAVALDVRDAAGRTVLWPWAEPLIAPQAGERQVRMGKRYGPVWLRVPAAATQALEVGNFTLAVRINRPAGRDPLTVSPVPIKVLAPTAAAEVETKISSIILALIDARTLRQIVQQGRSFLSRDERMFAEAAAGLTRVAPTAESLVREQPRSPRAALLHAEVLFAMANAPAASAALERVEAMPEAKEAMWAAPIAALRQRLATPATETDRTFEPYWKQALNSARSVGATSAPSTAGLPASTRATPANVPPPPAVPTAATAAGEGAVQWAVSARASSEYRATDYGARQATGAPDVTRYGDSGKAWAPKTPDLGEEWIELTYARPVHATAVRVVQNFNPGAIARIEVLDASGAATPVWSGPDATAYDKNAIGVLTAVFPRTARPVAKVKIVVNEQKVAGWNEIDAVALLGPPP